MTLRPLSSALGALAALVACGGAPTGGAPGGAPADADEDGLTDADEATHGTDAAKPDTDGDGKRDGDEVHRFHTDPTKRDTDGDGSADGAEIKNGTDPLVADVVTPQRGTLSTNPLADLPLPATGDAPPAAWQCDHADSSPRIISMSCFVASPGGTFRMGAQAADPTGPGYDAAAQPHEGPVREVTVSPFWIQRTEASTSLFNSCVTAGACRAEDALPAGAMSNQGDEARREHPVNGVSWEGATRLCGWLGGRLPTEAEWEFAARGTDGRRFPWGDQPGCGFTFTREAHGEVAPSSCIGQGTHKVDDGPLKSAGGLLHMSGNVWEWTADAYAPYDPAATRDPVQAAPPSATPHRVQRGGGWLSEAPEDFRSAARAAVPPDQKLPDAGLRCVWTGRTP